MSLLAKRPYILKIVAKIQLINVSAANAQPAEIDIYAGADVIGLFF